MENPRNVPLSYRVHRRDGGVTGTMVGGSRARISVHQSYGGPPEGGAPDIGASLGHPNNLHTLFINDNSPYHDSVHEEFDMTLREYLGNSHYFKRWAINVESNGPIFSTVRDKLKKIIKEMLEFVEYIHSEDVSLGLGELENLSIDNHLVVRGGVVKFWKLPFKRPADAAARKGDYDHVAKLIRDHLVRPVYGQVPGSPDLFPRLIAMMSSYHRASDAYFMVNHISLMSSSLQLIFIQSLKNRENFARKEFEGEYDRALVRMGNNSGWLGKLEDAPYRYYYLFRCLNKYHFGGAFEYDTPGFASYMRRNTKYYDGGRWREHTSNDKLIQINGSLLAMCRNLATHLPETTRAREGLAASVILSVFGYELEKFQRCLADEGILKYFLASGHDSQN